MTNKKKLVVGTVVLAVSGIIYFFWAIGFVAFFGIGIPSINAENAEKQLAKDYESMAIVAEYLGEENGMGIDISACKKTGKILLSRGRRSDENQRVFAALVDIEKKGYYHIELGWDAVCFLKWGNPLISERGILFSTDDRKLDFSNVFANSIVELKPLSRKNWYYYRKNSDEYENGKRPEPYDIPKEWGYE
ncbi:MAG: hypothetical protein FWH04_08300 [Oscillospiraceae bacterium]|nr:hypothetical protein [Oscillospiraceae bacterium]